ncbi:hypothetical protein D9M68_134950 [compost metagenome]
MNCADLDTLRTNSTLCAPCPRAELRNLRDDLVLRWTYQSNGIEGNLGMGLTVEWHH